MGSELEPSDGHLRISTAQRENAMRVLREAAADGRLEFDELDSRTTQVMDARTRGDLTKALSDLLPAADLAEAVGTPAPLGEGEGYSWDQPMMVNNPSWWRRRTLAGPWTVPPFMEVITKMGGVTLDFTQARGCPPVVDLVVMSGYGTITLLVPSGWGVDATTVVTSGSGQIRAGVPTRPRPGLPRIVLRGRTEGYLNIRAAADTPRAIGG